jgi:hypothetical protein
MDSSPTSIHFTPTKFANRVCLKLKYNAWGWVGGGKLRAAGEPTRAFIGEDCVLNEVATSAFAQTDHRDPVVGSGFATGVQNEVVSLTYECNINIGV